MASTNGDELLRRVNALDAAPLNMVIKQFFSVRPQDVHIDETYKPPVQLRLCQFQRNEYVARYYDKTDFSFHDMRWDFFKISPADGTASRIERVDTKLGMHLQRTLLTKEMSYSYQNDRCGLLNWLESIGQQARLIRSIELTVMGNNENDVLANYLSALYQEARLSGAPLRDEGVLSVEGFDCFAQRITFLQRVQVNGQWVVQTKVSDTQRPRPKEKLAVFWE